MSQPSDDVRTKWGITLFNLYKENGREEAAKELLGHDHFNRRDPCVNYDKWPRKIRPPSLPTLEELAELQPSSPSSPGSRAPSSLLARRPSSIALGNYQQAQPSPSRWSLVRQLHQRPADVTDVTSRPASSSSSTEPLTEQQRSAVASQVASSLCQQYLARSDRYQLVQPLNDLGCRSNKHWFLVHDQLVKTERLLTITSVTHRPQLLQQRDRAKILRERLTRAKHPYLFPVLDADLMDLPQGYPAVVVITPCSHSGSLRDILHKCTWDRDWNEKYCRPPVERLRLPVSQVRRLTLQLVEALLHLRRSGVASSFGHLHAGNVIVQNGVARLADLEASLLDYGPTDSSAVPSASDVLCVGALMFEMVSGRQPGPRGPSAADLALLDDDTRSQLAPVMEFIFDSPGGQEPSIDMLPRLEFFREVHLRELARRPSSLTEINSMVPVRPPELALSATSDNEQVNSRSPQRRRKRSSSMPGHNHKELQELRRMNEQLSQLIPH